MQKLEAASSAKSKFLSNMSHEIRTPMSAIIGMTGIAKSTDDIDRKSDCINKIEKASKHLLGIINQILDISKIEAEQFKLDSYTFRFEKMVEEVISVLTVSADEKSLLLEVDLDESIPEYIVTDERRLAQVLTNLLINAIKFTPESGRVSLSVKILPDAIMRVEVTDTGIGIPIELNIDLFDAFTQVEMSATRSFAGTGLGLPISKKIIEMMDGKIWFESEIGEGSRFIFEIPVKAGSAEDAVSHGAITDDIEPGLYKDFTVLIAEDMVINFEIVSALLEPTGINIEWAKNGEQVVSMFRDNPEHYD
jgi:signal transduction histidine kinase